MTQYFENQNCTLYADKYFSTIKSIIALRNKGINFWGSIRLDRLLSEDKTLKKQIEKLPVGNHYYFEYQ